MNAKELIITQYELVTKRGQHQKLARKNYQKCLMVSKQDLTCLEKLMDELRETDKRLDPEQFDSAVKGNCCEYCQAGWLESNK